MSASPIRYSIIPVSPAAHHFLVTCALENPAAEGQVFALPAWIPGSYLIRDFARQIIAIRAESAGKSVALNKIDKHTWQAAPTQNAAPLQVIYEVYAWDLSVRGAHLDETHAFFNGSSVFLSVLGQEDAPCLVHIQAPQGERFANWRVATSMPVASGEAACANLHDFGWYRSENYDELIDHPVEMGAFSLSSFEAGGVTHDVVITGKHDADLPRLLADLQKICAWQLDFFADSPNALGGLSERKAELKTAPFARYVFLITAVGEAYGGLEHRASTALLCSRNDLPYVGMSSNNEAYRGFLGLASHEYFHAWNIKRIKPAVFLPYALNHESYTRLLWVFEGFTSYYDDLVLLRSGLISPEEWLEMLAKTLSRVQRGAGRLRQSLAESSFDAWIKFYKPDENTPNAVVSYYTKGSLVAFALDLSLRSQSNGEISLDDLMRELWRQFGKPAIGVQEGDVQRLAETLSGCDFSEFFAEMVNGTAELPPRLNKLLKAFGIEMNFAVDSSTSPASKVSLGISTRTEDQALYLTHVDEGGAAQSAGLAAGDHLLAINELRVSAASFAKQLARFQPGENIHIHAFRRDELMSFWVKLAPAPAEKATFTISPQANRLRDELLWQPPMKPTIASKI